MRKDLVHLRNYALKVVRSFFFFGVDFLFFLCVCFGVFFVSFLIKATLRLPFFSLYFLNPLFNSQNTPRSWVGTPYNNRNATYSC